MSYLSAEFTEAALQRLYTDRSAIPAIEIWYNRALAKLSVPYTCHSVETHLGPTHVLHTGDAGSMPVILLHGLMNNALIWERQLPALQAYQIYAVDVPGQPGRSYPATPSFLTDDYPQWLSDVMTALGLQQAVLVGLSMGAMIALRAAAMLPGRVNGLVLLSPAGLAMLRPSMLRRVVQANLPGRDFQAAMRELMTYIFVTPGVPFDEDAGHMRDFLELIARYQKPLLNPLAALEGIVTGLPLAGARLRACTMPSMVMAGADDVMFDAVQVLRNAARQLPHFVGGRIIPQAGHAMIYQQTDVVNASLVQFLAQVAANYNQNGTSPSSLSKYPPRPSQ